jgi:hypothetical protein
MTAIRGCSVALALCMLGGATLPADAGMNKHNIVESKRIACKDKVDAKLTGDAKKQAWAKCMEDPSIYK